MRVFGLAWLLAAQAALAQVADSALGAKADGANGKPAATPTIPIADIAARADEAEAFAQQVVERSAGEGKAAALASELKLLEADVVAIGQKTPASRLRSMPIASLETLDRYLGFLDRELRQWQADLRAAVQPVSDDAAAIVQRRKLWQDTRNQAGDELPAVLAQRIDDLLGQFDRAEAAMSQPLSRLLALGREGSALHSRIGQAIAAVRLRIATVDRELWRRDSADLLSALRAADSGAVPQRDALLDDLRDEASFAAEFDLALRGGRHALQVFTLLLLPLLLWLAARARAALAMDASLAPYRRVLTRPFAVWLLLALTILLALHFFGPSTRLKLLFVAAWVPVVRLQPAGSRALLGGWVHVAGLCVLLNVLAYLVSGMGLAFRLVTLASCLVMLAALLGVLLRLRGRPARPGDRLLRSMPALLVLGTIAVGVALVANVAGNVTLAAMLADATLSSAYLGLFLLAFGNVLRGWASYLLRSKVVLVPPRSDKAVALPHVASRLLDLLLLLLWGYGTLDALRVLRPLREWLAALAGAGLRFGSLSVSVGGVALFCISVFLSFWVAKTVRGVLAEDVLPRMPLPRGVANSAATMSYYVLLLLGLMVALAAAGFEVSQITLVLGALSVGIGFGLQTVVNNFVSGLILMFERPIQPGDTVELSGTVGTVRDIGMRATTFTTFEGADVVVPNGMLLSDKLVNWTLSTSTRRIEVPVGVAYDSDPVRVRALLAEVVQATDGVAGNPPPSVLFTGFGDSALQFSVRAWTGYDNYVFVRSALGLAIHDALTRAGIEIPYPQQALHLRSIDAELLERLRAQRARGDEAPAG